MKIITGGVCAAKGFKANGIHCGIRKNKTKKDLALIVSDVVANAAAVYTTNLVKGAPIAVTKDHLANGKAQAVICNSGNANTCNANGVDIANQMPCV
jgi:glutamate N-acetyltransferase/amino-acid N-acetyltransferase